MGGGINKNSRGGDLKGVFKYKEGVWICIKNLIDTNTDINYLGGICRRRGGD